MTLTSIYRRKGRAGYTLEWQLPGMARPQRKSFRTLALARDAAAALREAARKPIPIFRQETFPDYAARWLRATKAAVREGTYRVYESVVRHHLIPAFPGRISDITRAEVRDLVVRLREAGLKKKSVANVRGTLHAILEAAGPDEDGLIGSNPAHYRSKSKLMRLGTTPGEHRANVKALDVDQSHLFLAAIAAAAPAHAMLFRTMIATGLRPGEAIALRPEDLDYRKGSIRIARAITRGRVQPCKTTAQGEFETVDMPTGLADDLKAWEAACAAEALSQGRPRPEWLFPGTSGGLRPRATAGHLDDSKRLGVAFKRVLRKAGLPLHFSPHCLRHTYATQQLAEGESIYYVQRQLRHADIRMTINTYGSWLPAGNRAAADRHYARLTGRAGESAGENVVGTVSVGTTIAEEDDATSVT